MEDFNKYFMKVILSNEEEISLIKFKLKEKIEKIQIRSKRKESIHKNIGKIIKMEIKRYLIECMKNKDFELTSFKIEDKLDPSSNNFYKFDIFLIYGEIVKSFSLTIKQGVVNEF